MLSKLTKLYPLSMGFSLLQPVFSQYNKQQEQSLRRVHTSATGLFIYQTILGARRIFWFSLSTCAPP